MTATYDEARAIEQDELEFFLKMLVSFAGEKGELRDKGEIIDFVRGYIEPYAYLKETN